jgi:hypothetical protein
VTVPRAARGTAGTAGSHTWSLNVSACAGQRSSTTGRIARNGGASPPVSAAIGDRVSHPLAVATTYLALRSTCTPRAGSCSAAPSLHPRGRNSRCSIWCRASHCTDSPRGHTCLFRAALPWRGSFRPGTCARRRFHGEMQRSGLNTLTARCVLAEDTDETDLPTTALWSGRVNC